MTGLVAKTLHAPGNPASRESLQKTVGIKDREHLAEHKVAVIGSLDLAR